jgi:hypothetical protein
VPRIVSPGPGEWPGPGREGLNPPSWRRPRAAVAAAAAVGGGSSGGGGGGGRGAGARRAAGAGDRMRMPGGLPVPAPAPPTRARNPRPGPAAARTDARTPAGGRAIGDPARPWRPPVPRALANAARPRPSAGCGAPVASAHLGSVSPSCHRPHQTGPPRRGELRPWPRPCCARWSRQASPDSGLCFPPLSPFESRHQLLPGELHSAPSLGPGRPRQP